MRAWFFLTIAILSEVTATLCLKVALAHPAVYVVVVLGYVAAFSSLHQVLRCGMHVGAAYGIWGATGVVLTAGLSALLFGEELTPLMLVGMACIIAGVACVEMGGREPKPELVEVQP
ncbi:SMR family transporter [Corynebacterium sp. MSK218]|uniref:DMT family transporter n=1 Tax=Corynebacterium sp. MSK218 TaxID=3050218 RepID=UPI00254DA48D|nr:SMR family transporter [Corynebacterium sp. MSK218]MDK8764394.1 SMR family transporter [Corynebacterium sp. MSK218]